MVQWLRVCSTLAEDLSFIPRTHVGWLTTAVIPAPGLSKAPTNTHMQTNKNNNYLLFLYLKNILYILILYNRIYLLYIIAYNYNISIYNYICCNYNIQHNIY